MRYQYLLFDADNTILDFARCEKEIILDMAIRFGLPLKSSTGESIVSLYRRHNAAVWRELEEGTMDVPTVKIERFRRLLSHIDSGTTARPVTAERLNREFITLISRCGHLVPTARQILEELAPVVLITNGFREVQRSRLGVTGIEHLFSHIFISEEVGAAKPQAAFFDAVRAALGYPDPVRCLVIGDSLTSDIQGGNNAGMDTCWFDRWNDHFELTDQSPAPTYRITRLMQLRDIVA